jgi:NAD(P)-dependent dehydrogenase (short-subunit alcohol dehydrogenase family)
VSRGTSISTHSVARPENGPMKSVLVTGATDGIGRATARLLLDQDWHVLVHGRNESKAARAASDLAALAHKGKTSPVWGDFSHMREVVGLAEQVTLLVPSLDVLVNNAGVYEKQRRITEDGLEMTMAVNHFAPFLLTSKLMRTIQKAPDARIVVVSSMTHQGAQINPDDLELSRDWSGYGAYAASKLANVLFTNALAERIRARNTTANALHPGVIGTKLLRSSFGMGGGAVEDGARTSVFLATSPEVAGISGKYFVDCRQKKPSRAARNTKLAESLWTSTEKILAEFL